MNAAHRFFGTLLLLALAGCGVSQTNELTAKNHPAPAATVVAATPQSQTPAAVVPAATTTVRPAVTPSATIPSTPAAPKSLRDYQQSLAKACQSDADCVVKNVGNCCGYLPQCVHKDVQTFPEQVKALCEKEGRSSICGFQEPAGCSCVNHQCRDRAGAGI